MKKVRILDKTFRPMISNEEIMTIIDGVAQKLNDSYCGTEKVPLMMCTLTGSLPFMGELMQRLDFDPMVGSIKISSYEGTQTTGNAQCTLGPTIPVDGQDVIIVEDIVDTGITTRKMREMFMEQGAKSVKVCTMLFKPEKFHAQEQVSGKMQEPEFIGKSIPNNFILGFGLDYDEYGRCLKDIYVLDE